MIKVYRTQIDVVYTTGTGVLNADDPIVAAFAEYCDGSLTYFSQHPDSALIQTHLAGGHRAVLLVAEQIILAEGLVRTPLCQVSTLPLLSANPASFQENIVPVLAAVAAAWALNLPLDLLHNGLQTY